MIKYFVSETGEALGGHCWKIGKYHILFFGKWTGFDYLNFRSDPAYGCIDRVWDLGIIEIRHTVKELPKEL
jgi:hypothetical protein